MKQIVNYLIVPLISIALLTIIFQWNTDEELIDSIIISTIISLVINFVPRYIKEKKAHNNR